MELIEEPRTLQRLAETLAAGLSQEQAAVQALRATVEEQIQALHKQDRNGVEDTTLQTSQEIHTLDRLREERARNIETLIEYLGLQEQASDLQSIIPALEEKLQAPQLIEQLNVLRENDSCRS